MIARMQCLLRVRRCFGGVGYAFSGHRVNQLGKFLTCPIHELMDRIELFVVIANGLHHLKPHANDREWRSEIVRQLADSFFVIFVLSHLVLKSKVLLGWRRIRKISVPGSKHRILHCFHSCF